MDADVTDFSSELIPVSTHERDDRRIWGKFVTSRYTTFTSRIYIYSSINATTELWQISRTLKLVNLSLDDGLFGFDVAVPAAAKPILSTDNDDSTGRVGDGNGNLIVSFFLPKTMMLSP